MSRLERRLYTAAAFLFGAISIAMAVGLFLGEGDPGQSRAVQAVQGALLVIAGVVAFWVGWRIWSGRGFRRSG